MINRVGYREPVPIWNRFQYNRYLPGPKCNADFGASFRWLSQLNTVARQISWGTSDSAPSPNVIFGLCGSRSFMLSWQRSEACAVAHRAEKDSGEQHFTDRNTHESNYSKTGL